MKKLLLFLLAIILLSAIFITVVAASSNDKSNAILINEYDRTIYGALSSDSTDDWYKSTLDFKERN